MVKVERQKDALAGMTVEGRDSCVPTIGNSGREVFGVSLARSEEKVGRPAKHE